MLRSLVALSTTTAFLATGCAGGRPWPAHPVAISTQDFATRGEIATIDVLPLDLQLWAAPDYNIDLTNLRAGTEENVMNVVLETLNRRNYAVGATIDWNGDYPGGNALSHDDVVATVGSLARYGAATVEHPGQLPIPFLPARLGTTTGADATLYVGGWGYVAPPQDNHVGEKIAEGVVIGLLVIGVVLVIAAVLGDHGSSGGHSGGGGGGHGGSSVSHGGTSAGHSGGMGGRNGGIGPGDLGTVGTSGGGRVLNVPLGSGRHSFTASRGIEYSHRGPSVAGAVADAFGRTALDLALSQPDWGDDPALPHDGDDSLMYLEMTLVDNHTGLVLWHAHQQFPADATSAADTARVARTVLQLLPSRGLSTRTAAN